MTQVSYHDPDRATTLAWEPHMTSYIQTNIFLLWTQPEQIPERPVEGTLDLNESIVWTRPTPSLSIQIVFITVERISLSRCRWVARCNPCSNTYIYIFWANEYHPQIQLSANKKDPTTMVAVRDLIRYRCIPFWFASGPRKTARQQLTSLAIVRSFIHGPTHENQPHAVSLPQSHQRKQLLVKVSLRVFLLPVTNILLY